MIDKKEEYVLGVALANEKIASEIVARVIDSVPLDAAAAQAILDVISDSEKERKEIKEYLTVATASRSVGEEISKQLELIVKCLEYQAADDVANNAELNATQDELKILSAKAKEYLVVTLANRKVAKSVSEKIDAAISFAAGIPDAIV